MLNGLGAALVPFLVSVRYLVETARWGKVYFGPFWQGRRGLTHRPMIMELVVELILLLTGQEVTARLEMEMGRTCPW